MLPLTYAGTGLLRQFRSPSLTLRLHSTSSVLVAMVIRPLALTKLGMSTVTLLRGVCRPEITRVSVRQKGLLLLIGAVTAFGTFTCLLLNIMHWAKNALTLNVRTCPPVATLPLNLLPTKTSFRHSTVPLFTSKCPCFTF